MRLSSLLFFAACTSSSHGSVVTLETPVTLPTVRATPPVVLASGAMPSLWGVSPGMTRDEVGAHLGAPGARRTREETKEWWTGAGYDPNIELPFIFGFDEQISYNDDDTADHESPVWNVYFARGRAVLFKVALYFDHTKPEVARFGFPPSCFIGGNASGIVESLGPADFVREGGARRFHYYLRRGILVMEEGGLVEVLDIFAPLDAARARQVADAVHVH